MRSTRPRANSEATRARESLGLSIRPTTARASLGLSLRLTRVRTINEAPDKGYSKTKKRKCMLRPEYPSQIKKLYTTRRAWALPAEECKRKKLVKSTGLKPREMFFLEED